MRPAALWAQRTATQAPDRHVLPLNAADRRRRTWAGLLLRRILHLLPLLGGGRGVRHALGTTDRAARAPEGVVDSLRSAGPRAAG